MVCGGVWCREWLVWFWCGFDAWYGVVFCVVWCVCDMVWRMRGVANGIAWCCVVYGVV